MICLPHMTSAVISDLSRSSSFPDSHSVYAKYAATMPERTIPSNVPAPPMLAMPVAIFSMSRKVEQVRPNERAEHAGHEGNRRGL